MMMMMMRAAVLRRCSAPAPLSEATRLAPPRILGALTRATRKLSGTGGASGEDDDDDASEITRERARSTAEEFSRHTKERIESAAETAKEETAKETAAGGSPGAKNKFEYEVEKKGNYDDKMGQD